MMINYFGRLIAGEARESILQGKYFTDIGTRLSKEIGDTGKASNIEDLFTGAKKLNEIGLDDAAGQNVLAVQRQINEDLKLSVQRTPEAISAMYRNARDGGGVFKGLSVASQTQSHAGASAFGALGNPDNVLGSMFAGAALGAGTASIFGGDPTEGAMLGGMVAVGAGIGAKAFRSSLSEMETGVMKRVLGDDFKTKDIAATTANPGMTIEQVAKINPNLRFDQVYGDSGPSHLGVRPSHTFGEAANKRVDHIGFDDYTQEYTKGFTKPFANIKLGNDVMTGSTIKAGQTARGANLQAIGQLSTSELKKASFIDRQLVGAMKNKDKASVGMQSRFATMSGAMLAGAAFTSSAGGDKRRGFNKNRGNRF